MNLLLDTCTFLWVIDRADQLSPRAREHLEDPASAVVFHQASAWEIQIKYRSGKLGLRNRPETLIREGLKRHDIAYQRMTDESIWHLGKLPEHHRDPFDRLLISHALTEGLKLVTPDPRIHEYPVACVW
mgnify:CR=1 FL=1